MDRLITHLLVQSLALHVSLELEGGSLSATLGAIVVSALMECVGAMGVAGAARLMVAWEYWKYCMAHYGVCSKCILN